MLSAILTALLASIAIIPLLALFDLLAMALITLIGALYHIRKTRKEP